MVCFHVLGGILVILCIFGGGGHFFKLLRVFQSLFRFQRQFGLFFFFLLLRCIGLFIGIGCMLDILCGYEGIVVVFSIYRAILVLFK